MAPPSAERLKEPISAIESLRARYVTRQKEILAGRIVATGIVRELLDTELNENTRAIASADHALASLRGP